MNFVEAIFNKDIVLDEEAFDSAVKDFEDLGVRLENLRKEIDQTLETLQTGFDTPAGRKFITSCRNNLIKPLEDQGAVLQHISNTLQQSRQEYSTVFREYAALQTTIHQAV